jgi:hypothetical protein
MSDKHVVFGGPARLGTPRLANWPDQAATCGPSRYIGRASCRRASIGEAQMSHSSKRPLMPRRVRRPSINVSTLHTPSGRKCSPPLQRGALAAAERTDAVLVTLENVYSYVPSGGKPMTENHSLSATTVKGRTRAAMTRELLAAADAGRIRSAIGRASDLFGTGGDRVGAGQSGVPKTGHTEDETHRSSRRRSSPQGKPNPNIASTHLPARVCGV